MPRPGRRTDLSGAARGKAKKPGLHYGILAQPRSR